MQWTRYPNNSEWIRYSDIDSDKVLYKCSQCGHEIWIDFSKSESIPNKCPSCCKKVDDNQ